MDDAIEEDGLELIIFTNNLYPDYYPLPFELTTDLIDEIEKILILIRRMIVARSARDI